jgi:hypothetical protein
VCLLTAQEPCMIQLPVEEVTSALRVHTHGDHHAVPLGLLQAVLSLLPSADNAPAASLSLRHSALQHFATAAHLASFIRRADLAESAARLAYNTVTGPGALLETPLTRAAAVKALTTVAHALNATRPADISFQVGSSACTEGLSCRATVGAVANIGK